MIDHVGISVTSYTASCAFYSKALAPLGYKLVKEEQGWAGFGTGDNADFWLTESQPSTGPMHIAFYAGSRSEVNAFYEAAMSAGGADNGPPGVRDLYHPHYYGGFIHDPDGHNVEAVCHFPE